MPFTGRLGTQNSDLGNIVLGIADSLDVFTFGFDVHVITSKQIRVRFDHAVTADSALISSNYIIASLASPGTALVPNIISVSFYSDDRKSIVLNLDAPLTYNTIYSLNMVGIVDDSGESVSSGAKNFTDNVQDPPRILGAYLSERGFIDVLFDRSVGPSSPTPTATIEGVTVGPATALLSTVWAPPLPETTLRFQLQVEMEPDSAYVVNVSGVVDSSFNTNSGQISLDLVLRAPTPYDFTILTQVQIIDAYVADVSNDLINTATVRVYFNCNVDYSGSINQSNWTVSLESGHKNTDYFDTITSAPPTDLPSLIISVNELKAKINAHEVGAEIHYLDDIFNTVVSTNATDLPTSLTLVNEIQTKYLSHILQNGIHLYPDTINSFVYSPAANLSSAIAASTELRGAYTAHIQALYPTTFSLSYNATPIGEIFSFASTSHSYQNVAPDTGPYNYFVDLHVKCPTNLAGIYITASVTSEDGGSSTNPSDYTGSITARPGGSAAGVLSSYFLTDSFLSIQSDREISSYESPDILNLTTNQKISGEISRTATLSSLLWVINQLMFAYSKHIDSLFGAGHQINDTTNLIVGDEYPIQIDLSTLIVAANVLKIRFNTHASSSIFHYNADNFLITAPDAIDLPSLVFLVYNIRDVFLHHNASGFNQRPTKDVFPKFLGIHAYPGYRIFSARLYNLFQVIPEIIQDGISYEIEIPSTDVYHDNLSTINILHTDLITTNFIAVATRPSLASALPIIGYNPLDPKNELNSDIVQVFFSKPMHKIPLDGTNLPLTGGSIVVEGINWTGDTTASICVNDMTTISYSLQAINLTDLDGNLIY